MTGKDYLHVWIKETYPLIDDFNELDYHDMVKFANWMIKIHTINAQKIEKRPLYDDFHSDKNVNY